MVVLKLDVKKIKGGTHKNSDLDGTSKRDLKLQYIFVYHLIGLCTSEPG